MDARASIINNRWLLVVLALIAVFQFATIRPGMSGNEDACLYLAHARNLVTGRPYADTGFIYSSESPDYSPAMYPPVFPILIAPLFRVSGLNPMPYKAFMACVLVLCLFAVAMLYRDRTSRRQTLLLTFLLGFNPYLTEQKNEITSDLPFMLFLYVAFLFLGDASNRESRPFACLRRAVLAGFFCYLAYGTRSVGIGIIPCVIVFSFIRHRRATRFAMIATVVFAVLACVQAIFLHGGSGYLRVALSRAHSPLQNLHFYAGVIERLWDAGIGPIPRLALFVLATALCVAGLVRRRGNRWDLPTLFSLGYGLLLVFWPIAQARYLIPLIPIYFYFIVWGLKSTEEAWLLRWPRFASAVTPAAVSVLLLGYVGQYANVGFGPNAGFWYAPAAQQVYSFLRTSTPADAIVMADAPRALALYANRRAAQFPDPLNAASLTRTIPELGATYLVVSQRDGNELGSLPPSLLDAGPIFANADYSVYKAKAAIGHP